MALHRRAPLGLDIYVNPFFFWSLTGMYSAFYCNSMQFSHFPFRCCHLGLPFSPCILLSLQIWRLYFFVLWATVPQHLFISILIINWKFSQIPQVIQGLIFSDTFNCCTKFIISFIFNLISLWFRSFQLARLSLLSTSPNFLIL